MANVRVYNDNKHPYSENFRDQKIVIPAGGFIEMDEYDAVVFKGTYAPIILTDGMDPSAGYKMIRVTPIPGEDYSVPVDTKTCLACKYKASSAKDLEEHAKAKHAADLFVDEEAERAIALAAKKKKAQKSA